MAVFYYEGLPISAPLTIESNEPHWVSETINLRQERTSQGAQRWELSFSVQSNELDADFFLGNLLGFDEAQTMIMPQLNNVMSKISSDMLNPTVNSEAAKGSTSLNIGVISNGKLIPKGTFIKFSNHNKIYVVRQNVLGNGVNNKTVNIYPSLRATVPIGANMLIPAGGSWPEITYLKDDSNLKGITYTDGVMFNSASIRLLEDI